MTSVGSLARIVGPPFGGGLLNRDVMDHAAHFGRTLYWTTGSLMLVGFSVALTLHTPRHARAPEPVRTESLKRTVKSDE
jgi:hypothetical protein